MNRMGGKAMRQMYESGYGIEAIIGYTNMTYMEVIERLRTAGTNLITGGPHDTETCRHNHFEIMDLQGSGELESA